MQVASIDSPRDCRPGIGQSTGMKKLLQFLDARVVLSTPKRLGRLEEFLIDYFSPYFWNKEVGDDLVGEDVPTITLVKKTLDRRSIERFRTGQRCEIDMSGGVLRMWGYRSPDVVVGGDVLLMPWEVVLSQPSPHRFELTFQDEERVLIPALRIIEDLVVPEVERGGGVFVHASAVVCGGKALLFIGNKGAGKTSTLCRSLSEFDASMLSNDNCVLRWSGAELVACGWPGLFKVDIGTMSNYCEFAPYFPESRESALPSAAALWGTREKVSFYPQQGANLFGASITPQAPVGALITPLFSKTKPAHLRKRPIEELRLQASEFIQGSKHPNHPNWLQRNRLDPSILEARVEQLLALTSETIPNFELVWGLSLEDLLSDIPAMRASRKSIVACGNPRRSVGREERFARSPPNAVSN
jgi:hypothetical protein